MILSAALALTLGLQLHAANPYAWTATTNEVLYGNLLSFLRTMQSDLVAEPAYYMTQSLVTELEAVHKSQPYAWLNQVHNFCNILEGMYPVAMSCPRVGTADRFEKIRRDILLLRDYPMHQVTLDNDLYIPSQEQKDSFHTANKQWLQLKRKEFFDFLNSPRPTGDEIQIVKLYSSGYVLRTKNTCIGIDICYGEGLYDGDRKAELVDMLDIIYNTHAHGDHYDIELMRLMLEKGKCVVAPATMDRHFPGTYKGTKYMWSETVEEPVSIGGKNKACAYMAEQGTEPCLIYHIEMDGWRIIHVGDNSNQPIQEFFTRYQMADIVMSPVFQGVVPLLRFTLQAPNPLGTDQFWFNQHENEWHHTIEGRISYYFTYNEGSSLGAGTFNYPPIFLFDNGEHITLHK